MAGITQNYTKRERAAVLIAEDEQTDEAIALAVGVTRKTLHNWKQDPGFAALVGDNVGRIQAGMLKLTIAKKHKRLEVLDDLHTKALQVITQRGFRHAGELAEAESAAMATRRFFGTNTPEEAATGLLVKQETTNNSGIKTVNWAVDPGLMKEIRALQEQAAKELGQWVEKGEVNVGGSLKREYVIVRDGEG